MADAPSEPSLAIRNPRTGLVDHDMPVFSADQVAAVASQLRRQQVAWAASGAAARAASLLRFADAIVAVRSELIDAIAQDTGRYAESVMEVDGTVGAIKRWAVDATALLRAAPASHVARASSMPHISVEQHARPFALVGIISPWNFPLLLSLIDAYPALMAGCAVMVKPSEVTPRFVPVLERALNAVPELTQVLQIVTGAGATGGALVASVDLICFTGSVATGRKVAVQAAQAFIGAHLELGGKDAAVVCASADIARTARSICWASMVNAGQSCMSLERAYVEQSIFEPFVAALVKEVAALKHCWPDIRVGQIGPVISVAQAQIIERHLVDAVAKGAKVLTGGQIKVLGGGLWCEPTVLTHTTADMAIVAEETFAPILPVMAFEGEAQAIELANSTEFGLSACVFSGDIEQAKRIASQLEVGAVSINDASLTALVHDAAKQSFKSSGLGGSRMGAASLQRFYRQQAYLVSNGTDSPWWFRRS